MDKHFKRWGIPIAAATTLSVALGAFLVPAAYAVGTEDPVVITTDDTTTTQVIETEQETILPETTTDESGSQPEAKVDTVEEEPAPPLTQSSSKVANTLAVLQVDTKPTTSLDNPAQWINSSNYTFTLSATDDIGLARITGNVYNATNTTLIKSNSLVVTGTAASFTIDLSSLPEGVYTLRYNSSDTTGQISSTKTYVFTNDKTAPTVAQKQGVVVVNGRTTTTSLKLNDPGTNASGIAYSLVNGVRYDKSPSVWSDENGITPGSYHGIGDGQVVEVFDVDRAGNLSDYDPTTPGNQPYTVTLDVSGPVITNKATGQQCVPGTVPVVPSFSAGLADAANVDFTLVDTTKFDKTNNPYSDENGIAPNSYHGAGEGPHTLYAVDELGNQSSCSFILDISVAVLSLSPIQWVSDASVLNISQVEANPAWIYAEVQRKDQNGIWRKVTGQQFNGVNAATYDPNLSSLTSADEIGEYQWKITSRDLAGHNTSVTQPFKLDVTAPVLTIKPSSTVAPGGYLVVDIKAYDARSGVDFGTIGTCKLDRVNAIYTDFNTLKPGKDCVVLGPNTLFGSDVAGNIGKKEFVLVAPAVVTPSAPPSTTPSNPPVVDVPSDGGNGGAGSGGNNAGGGSTVNTASMSNASSTVPNPISAHPVSGVPYDVGLVLMIVVLAILAGVVAVYLRYRRPAQTA